MVDQLAGHVEAGQRRRKRAGRWSEFSRPGFYLPAFFLGLVVLSAIFGPLIAPHDPELARLSKAFVPPFWQAGGELAYPLGTDALGRDMLSRLIVGARASMLVALVTVVLAGGIGFTLGILAGYFGGKLDAVIMRVVDVMFSIPVLFLALVLAAQLGPGLGNLFLIITLVAWSKFARLIRGEVLAIREREFILAARSCGASAARIIIRHVVPNVFGTAIVMATLQIAWIIIVESSLSFLGVGVPPPSPAWGSMLADGRADMAKAWWVSVLPGLAVLFTALSINVLGDWLRDALDPRRQHRGSDWSVG